MSPVFVPFPEPRVAATFLGRRKRFFADVELADGTKAVAHCPNTGSMKGCLAPGAPAVLWESPDPKRKLRYSWKAIECGGTWVGVDTSLTNRIAEAAIRAGALPALTGYAEILRERRLGDSRIDLYLHRGDVPCYVEVKNVSLVEEGLARFPDAVTERGLRHLGELTAAVAGGLRAAMVYVVQRSDARAFEPAADIDPAYARGLSTAAAAGVGVYALATRVSPVGVEVLGELAWRR